MEDKSKKIFDKLTQTLPKPEDLTKEFTYKNPVGVQIYDALANLNMIEVELHDIITKNVFKGIDYYSIVGLIPLWIRDDGHSQEGCSSKEKFESLVNANDNELTHKVLYYHDCEMLMSSFQNRTAALGRLINRIYEILTPQSIS